MSQHYSDPSREDDPHALPDVEVFYIGANNEEHFNDDGDPLPSGYYYWFCFPGCLPDSDPIGPFETRALAEAAAQEDTNNA